MVVFDHAQPKIIESTFSFPEFVTIFFTMPTQKNFDQLLIFVITYQHAKIQFFPSFYSLD